jgi:hypothetical protein
MINSTLNKELQASIVASIRQEHEEKSALHEPSGKLSASQLGKPLLEQVLKIIGVPQKPIEDYALGLFRRGDSVEQNVIDLLKPDETQIPVEYKNVVGVIDAIKDGNLYEIKSVKNSQFQYLDPENTKQKRTAEGLVPVYDGVKYAHALQAGLYALATGKDRFTIIYTSADDLRTIPHTIETKEVKDEIETIIKEVSDAIKSKRLPKWSARERWQAIYPQYSSYPEWMTLNTDLAMEKLKRQYPDAYKKLTGEIK